MKKYNCNKYKSLPKERFPKKKQFIIFSVFPKGYPYLIGGDGTFVPVFDSTDHFHWACEKCKVLARVIMVKRDDTYAERPTIYFYLKCPKCGKEGQRKIYLDQTEKERGTLFLEFPVEITPISMIKNF